MLDDLKIMIGIELGETSMDDRLRLILSSATSRLKILLIKQVLYKYQIIFPKTVKIGLIICNIFQNFGNQVINMKILSLTFAPY